MRKNSRSPESTSQKVEAFIRKAIYTGRLKPRERIIEDDIARLVGCSRGPVREAVLRLERDGMIVINPRRGTFIRDISPDEIEVVYSLRGKLEGLCARYMRSSPMPDKEKESILTQSLQTMKKAVDAGDDEAFLQADMRLHRMLWKLSGKQQLFRTLNFVMNPLFFMIARAYSPLVNSLEDSYANHEGYVKTLLTAPAARLEREVEKYWNTLYKSLSTNVLLRSVSPLGQWSDQFNDLNNMDEPD